MKKQDFLKIVFLLIFITSYELRATNYELFAQDNNRLAVLTKEIVEVKAGVDAYLAFEELVDLYFKDHKYNEFLAYLKSLPNKNKKLEPAVNYYTALTRYYQLKYFEEIQNWDEYFNQGNTYREEIVLSAQKTIDSLGPGDVLSIYARLILWKFHSDQQDALSEPSLSTLMDSTLAYAKDAVNLVPLKDVAGELTSYGEKAKAKQIYKVYVERLGSSDALDDELKQIAEGFYKEGNLDLSEAIYDLYIERIAKKLSKEQLIPILADVAKAFSYKDSANKDELYAEKVFKKIEEIGGMGVFSEDLLYLRAFNLEKAKDYLLAKDIYTELVRRYPQTLFADESDFKVGIIYVYVARDVKTGRIFFEKLAQKEKPSPQVISSLYQLGLLSQWEGDLVKAKERYDKLLAKAGDGFVDTVTLTKERLKEIEESKSIEYNLKTFLDVSLREENAIYDMSKVDLRVHPYRTGINGNVNISASTYAGESGCMQVELQYLWSGHLGQNLPQDNQPSFPTQYSQKGTKEINLVVVSPAGVIDRDIDLLDAD